MMTDRKNKDLKMIAPVGARIEIYFGRVLSDLPNMIAPVGARIEITSMFM